MALFGGSLYWKSHRLRRQLRACPEWLRFTNRLEASTLIKTSRWTITARDTQVHGGHIPYPRPGDDRFHEPPPSARTAMARSDPHLIENSDVRIRRINSDVRPYAMRPHARGTTHAHT